VLGMDAPVRSACRCCGGCARSLPRAPGPAPSGAASGPAERARGLGLAGRRAGGAVTRAYNTVCPPAPSAATPEPAPTARTRPRPQPGPRTQPTRW